MKDARTKKLAFILTVKNITLREKELARAGLCFRQRIANTPRRPELRRWIILTLQPVLNLPLTLKVDVGRVVRQVINGSRCQNCRTAIRIKGKKPHTGNAVMMNVSTHVQLVHRV